MPPFARSHPPVRSRIAAVGALLLAGGIAAACSTTGAAPSTSAGPGGSAPSTGTLRLGYFPNVTHATALIGVEKGYFQEALGRIKLENQTFNSGTTASEALLSDAIDATYIGPNPAVNAFSKSNGEAIRIVSGATSGGAFLVVKPEIAAAAQLKGRKLATPSIGNTQDVALRFWLKQQGLSSDQAGGGDVAILPQENAQTLETFRSGDIDGAWVPEPWATRLIQEGGGKVLVDEATLWPGGKFVTTHLMVRTDFLTQHPDVIKRLLEGQVKANEFIARDSAAAQAAANTAIEKITTKKLPEAVITASWKNLTFTDDPIAVVAPGRARERGGRRAHQGDRPQGHLRPDAAERGAGSGRQADDRHALTTNTIDTVDLVEMAVTTGTEPRHAAAALPSVTHDEAPADTAIRLDRVTKVYGTGRDAVVALDGLTLDVPAGGFVTLVGASGCGKSTLLNLIVGLDRPTSGAVSTSGRRSTLIFQEAALFPWLTAAENIELALKLRGIGRRDRRAIVEDLLERVHLAGFGGKRPHELSGGMRQRVAIARALAQEAEVLLMDEPFGALDAMTRDLLHDEVERLWRESKLTVMFVTHNVREAVRLGDRVVLLSSRPGRVIAEFPVEIERPRRIESAEVGALSAEIRDQLVTEVRRHATA